MENDKKKYIIAILGTTISIIVIVVLLLIINKNNTNITELEDGIENDIKNYDGKIISCLDTNDKYFKYVFFINKNNTAFTRLISEYTSPIGYYANYNSSEYLNDEDKANIEKEIYYTFGLEYTNYDGIKIKVTYPSDIIYKALIAIDIDYLQANESYIDKLGLNFNKVDNFSGKINELLNNKDFNCQYIK